MDVYPSDFIWPSQRALRKSGDAAREGLHDELKYISDNRYSDDEVRMFVAHARQDIALNAGLLKATHQQLVKISRGIWIIALILLLIALK